MSRFFIGCALALFLAGCGESKQQAVSQQDFQALVQQGFPSPQIVAVNLPATARASLYLETPEVTFGDSRSRVDWVIPGTVDIDFAGQVSSGKMSIVLEGSSMLTINPSEGLVFLDKAEIAGKDIAVESNLVQMLVLDALAKMVAENLNGLLLMSVPEQSPLSEFLAEHQQQSISYQIEPEQIVFEVKAEAKQGEAKPGEAGP
ncbi:hypothetical protein [Parendozoicomonas haliclonae]|uniref:hypothetical protein n=1 Tax=Parendozoicomonas haliclonae TaxID=1960125 RepID=UPI0010545274|nr:hypothetical protein [Parendozoicomonas haliclonae]